MESRRASTTGVLPHTYRPRRFTRHLTFAIVVVAVISAKSLHIYAHLDALQPHTILVWGMSFFLQDSVFLLLFYLLLDWGLFALCVAAFVAALVLLMDSVSMAFYITAGTELRWKNLNAIHGPSAFRMLATGVAVLLVVMALLILVSMVLQPFCFFVADACIDVLRIPIRFVVNYVAKWRGKEEVGKGEENEVYLLLSHHLDDHEYGSGVETNQLTRTFSTLPQASYSRLCLRSLVALGMALQVLCTIFRPPDSSLLFLSWTLPSMPIVHLVVGGTLSTVVALPVTFQHISALGEPKPFMWLPEPPHPGFEDWYRRMPHYDAEKDPLRLPNIDEELLPALQDIIRNISIQNVVLLTLESTRKDVFPLEKNNGVWDRLASTFKDNLVPLPVEQQLASLTPTARYLTGNLESGFVNGSHNIEHGGRTFRGGINAQNAHTTATYTLKSLLGTHCGVMPLVADFNREFTEHIYQPCLPHILDVMNDIKCGDEGDKGVKKWSSKFMQSTTLGYDNQDELMSKLGFSTEKIVGGEYLKEEGHKFAPKHLSDVNYYGMPEVAIEEYLRDAIATANTNDEHLFLSHLTSTTHHNFKVPNDEDMVPLVGNGDWAMLSDYLNSIGYVDRWLARIMDILEEEGVADKTLIVLVGDHGLSIAEDLSFTPYHNPMIGNFHVPLVVSHPALPVIDIADPVTSLQILPTLLDLLIETDTFPKCKAAAARDMLRNYEGQSLLRPQKTASDNSEYLGWQFTIMNPGASSLAVRNANEPDMRLIVPLQSGSEWRFTDLQDDPHEKEPLLSFDYQDLMSRLKDQIHRAWVERAVQVTEWWIKENRKRYRFRP